MLTYENLPGATGSRIFYKPERVKARDTFRGRLPALMIGDTAGVLEEIGMTEIAVFVRSPAAAPLVSGRLLPLRFILDGEVLEDTEAVVVDAERTELGQRLILQIAGGYIDIRALQARHRTLILRGEINTILEPSSQKVPLAYRLLCMETIDLFRHLQTTLDRFEATKPTPDAQAEMFAMCEDSIIPRWRDIWRRANELVAPLMNDAEALGAAKSFTERVLTPHFMPGAIWRRSYEKPLGYPGDFQIMSMVYDWQREGGTFFEKFCHRLGLEVAECIATRLNIIRRAIADTVGATPGGCRKNCQPGFRPCSGSVRFPCCLSPAAKGNRLHADRSGYVCNGQRL